MVLCIDHSTDQSTPCIGTIASLKINMKMDDMGIYGKLLGSIIRYWRVSHVDGFFENFEMEHCAGKKGITDF